MQICQACGTENPIYTSHCLNCANVIRNRVPNIDFWQVFWKLIESPKEALTIIVQSEKKNFILFILIFIAMKVSINSQYIYIHGFGHEAPHPASSTALWLFVFLVWLIVPFLMFQLLRFTKKKMRLKDFVVVVYYSHLPVVATFFLLFIPQFILWGPFLFTNSPSPFLIYKNLAFFFTGLEVVSLIWSLSLLCNGLGLLLGKTKIRFIIGTVVFLLLHAIPAVVLMFF